MIKDPILITGCPRSGTSMVAGIVNMGGAWGGDMRGATRYNKKGMFENSSLIKYVVKPFLRDLGVDPLGQFPLPNIDRLLLQNKGIREFRTEVLKIVINQGLKDDQTWFFKDPKICLFWPIWWRAFPDSQWIIVRRDDQSIIESCIKTSWMRAFDSGNGWQWYVNQHKKRFEEILTSCCNSYSIWPCKMIENNDFSYMKQIIEWLKLEWKEEEIIDFLTPSLWHYRGKDNG